MGGGDVQDFVIAAGGMNFQAREWGPADGPTVLLLHGFPQRSTSWRPVAEQLAAAGLHVVAVDQRGYSPGARPEGVAAYGRPHLIGDVAAIIDALGGPVHLVGHDWGAVVGWQVAIDHPDKLHSWTAISTPNPTALNHVLATDDSQRQAFGYIVIFREPGRAESALLGNGAVALRAIYSGAVQDDIVAADVEFFSQPGVLTAALNWYRAMDINDTTGLANVTVPTTYIWGSEDPAFLRTAAETSGDYVDADYRFVPLPGMSHWVPNEAASVVAEEIIRRVG